jgi:dolichyl-diphosphooligosaccharide--protein glycosyltransferase
VLTVLGVFPEIRERDYLSNGEYRVDDKAAPALTNSLMYKLSYYRFEKLQADGYPMGYDRTRKVQISSKKITLKHLAEVYTSEHWLVRIYKLRKPSNRRWKKTNVKE